MQIRLGLLLQWIQLKNYCNSFENKQTNKQTQLYGIVHLYFKHEKEYEK